jgi:hypothetical protein
VEQKIDETTSGRDFSQVLDALLEELMAASGNLKDVVVVAPDKFVAHVREWLGSHCRTGMDVEGSAALRDGVAIQDKKRSYRISNTLRGRYGRLEQETRRVCMTGLFGESGRDA